MTISATSRAGRLLLAESAALLPILRATPPADLDRPTVLPGWSVRDVLAHCSAALGMTVTGEFHSFSPEDNQQDVDARAGRPIAELLAELEGAYDGAAAVMDAAGGRLDGLALGEWVHGGDVREALGRSDAYASAGLDDALVLLVERSADRGAPSTTLTLTGPAPERELPFGRLDAEVSAHLRTDTATLFRLCAGRGADPAAYTLTGATPAEYLLFT